MHPMKTSRLSQFLFAVAVLAGAGWMALNYQGAGGDMTRAAEAFLASLTAEQRVQATMEYDDPKRLDWHFIPKPERKGLQIKHMNEEQRKAAHALLASGVSQLGYDKAVTIMSLEAILQELEKARKDGPIRDAERYYFTVFGTPHAHGKWGWSVEGHHLSLNFAVSDGTAVAHTPAFFGANPALVHKEVGSSPKKGTRTLVHEEALAFELFNSLDEQQRKTALIAEKAPMDLRGAGEPQAPGGAPEGLAADKLTPEQTKTLRSLISAYTDNMAKELAEQRWAEIEEHGFGKIHFAWAGADKPGIGHYYRIQGVTFLVEFVNTQPDAEGNPANHIHCVWRSLKGDFGIARE
jgi:hypothetical protein